MAELTPWFKTNEDFQGTYFQKQFAEELLKENQDEMTKQEKLENATRLFDLAKSKTMPKDFLNLLLNQVLTWGPQVGVYSKEHFREFIDMNEKTASYFAGHKDRIEENRQKQLKQKGAKKATNWNQYLSKAQVQP